MALDDAIHVFIKVPQKDGFSFTAPSGRPTNVVRRANELIQQRRQVRRNKQMMTSAEIKKSFYNSKSLHRSPPSLEITPNSSYSTGTSSFDQHDGNNHNANIDYVNNISNIPFTPTSIIGKDLHVMKNDNFNDNISAMFPSPRDESFDSFHQAAHLREECNNFDEDDDFAITYDLD